MMRLLGAVSAAQEGDVGNYDGQRRVRYIERYRTGGNTQVGAEQSTKERKRGAKVRLTIPTPIYSSVMPLQTNRSFNGQKIGEEDVKIVTAALPLCTSLQILRYVHPSLLLRPQGPQPRSLTATRLPAA